MLRNFIASLILSMVFYHIAMGQIEINRPRYLVEKQLIPYVITADVNIPLSEAYLEGSGKQELKQSHLFIDSYLIPVISSKKNLVIIGGGYMGNRFVSDSTIIGADKYNGAYTSIFATGSIREKLFWVSYQSFGTFSDEIFQDMNVNMKYFQFTKFGYKWNENLATSAGFMYMSNFGKPLILPLLSISYSKNNFIINADLPLKIDAEYLVKDRTRFYVNTSFNSWMFYSKSLETGFNLENNKVLVGIKYNAFKYTWLHIGVMKMINNNHNLQNDSLSLGALKNDYRLSMGISIHID